MVSLTGKPRLNLKEPTVGGCPAAICMPSSHATSLFLKGDPRIVFSVAAPPVPVLVIAITEKRYLLFTKNLAPCQLELVFLKS